MTKFRKFCTRFLSVVVGRLLLIPFFPVVAITTLGIVAAVTLGLLALDLIITGDWATGPDQVLRP